MIENGRSRNEITIFIYIYIYINLDVTLEYNPKYILHCLAKCDILVNRIIL
jgi:hypothetical protein